MTVESFEGKAPRLGDGCWVHPSAEVFGDVTLGARCWIGRGACLRGDCGTIVLADCCAVDDNAVVYARPDVASGCSLPRGRRPFRRC